MSATCHATQRALPLPVPRGEIAEESCGETSVVRVNGAVVARVQPGERGWECVHIGATCTRAYASRSEALSVARRIARLLVAGERDSWRRLTA